MALYTKEQNTVEKYLEETGDTRVFLWKVEFGQVGIESALSPVWEINSKYIRHQFKDTHVIWYDLDNKPVLELEKSQLKDIIDNSDTGFVSQSGLGPVYFNLLKSLPESELSEDEKHTLRVIDEDVSIRDLPLKDDPKEVINQ